MQHSAVNDYIGNEIHIDRESVQAWLEKIFTKERLTGIGLTVATLGITGWLLFALDEAMQNYQVVGPGFF